MQGNSLLTVTLGLVGFEWLRVGCFIPAKLIIYKKKSYY